MCYIVKKNTAYLMYIYAVFFYLNDNILAQ